jgi:hypothetical protein
MKRSLILAAILGDAILLGSTAAPVTLTNPSPSARITVSFRMA